MFVVRPSLLIVVLGASVAWADVVTTLKGSRLVVTGDSAPNVVSIEPAPDGILVRGLEGTLVDGSSVGVTVSGVESLTVKLRKASDSLTLTQVTLSKGIDLRLGRGDDDVVLDGVRCGAARIRTGNGSDAVIVMGGSRLKSLSVETSNERDLVVLDGAWISGDLDIDTGSDDDDVHIFATQVGDDVHVRLGNDDDFIVLADVSVDDDTEVDGEHGDDALFLDGYLWFGDDVDFDGFDDDW